MLGFFAFAWIGLLLTLLLAPEVYASALGVAPSGDPIPIALFLAGLSSFLVLLSIGTVRRWRWMFWLIVVAFLFGILRVPVAALQLGGWMQQERPSWHAVLQAILGVVENTGVGSVQ